MKTILTVLGAIVLVATSVARAEDSAVQCDGTQGVVAQGATQPGSEHASDNTDDIFWDFITCVHTAHECSHEAQHHGFPHYKAVHDHHMCPGTGHLACYGGHH